MGQMGQEKRLQKLKIHRQFQLETVRDKCTFGDLEVDEMLKTT